MALVLTPEPPLDGWLSGLDEQMQRSPAVLGGRPVVVDAAGVAPGDPAAEGLLAALRSRGIRVIGVEGTDAAWAAAEAWQRQPMPGGRARPAETAETAPHTEEAANPALPDPGPTSLVVREPVRSGQAVVFQDGDVTVLGSIASGAEVFAGGSIHVYGTLRGRAVAGFNGDSGARIFCRRFEAELLAIDGVYRTADDMEPGLRGRAVQAWLDGDRIMMAALDP